MKTLLGIFVILHGLVHVSYLTPKPNDPKYPFDFTKSWFARLSGKLANPVGRILVIVTIVAFLLAGLGIIGLFGLEASWKFFTTVGAISSLLLLTLFWHSWLILGVIINLLLLYAAYEVN